MFGLIDLPGSPFSWEADVVGETLRRETRTNVFSHLMDATKVELDELMGVHWSYFGSMYEV